ncbi:MAG: hypothetical protein ACP5NO_02950 [Thermoplasmata archaeon]
MTADLDTLKAIKEKEKESQERLARAADEAKRIVKEAQERKKEILREAEEAARKEYEEKMNAEREAASKDAKEIERKFDEEIGKLKRQVSKEVLDKMMNTILE